MAAARGILTTRRRKRDGAPSLGIAHPALARS
jgi:hypothetical protein